MKMSLSLSPLAIVVAVALASPSLRAAELEVPGSETAAAKRPLPEGTIRFRTGAADITPASARALDRVADFLKAQSVGNVLLVGHTDRHGKAAANRRLSKYRAQRIKRELTQRGIKSGRISVMGVGFAEPLDPRKNEAADTLNRRVEVWVGTRKAVAYVSWIHHIVEAQRPSVANWDPAAIQMELRRLFRVRTREDSAGEVTFAEGHQVFLSSNALMVVYGRSGGRVTKSSVADVSLEQGSLLARMSRKTATLAVDTTAGRTELVRSRSARVANNTKKKQTTLSVYDGRAQVTAQKKKVDVPKGYGTRTKDGQVPEPPKKLAPAPTWPSEEPAVGFAGLGVPLKWSKAIEHDAAIVEVGAGDDQELLRPFSNLEVSGESVRFAKLKPGRYRVRVTSVADNDVVGHPSTTRDMVVLPEPKSQEGLPMPVQGDRVVLSRPTTLELPEVSGVAWTVDGAAAQRQAHLTPGTHVVAATLTDAIGTVTGRTTFVVGALKLTVRETGVSFLDSVDSVTPMVIAVTDEGGAPVKGLRLIAATPSAGSTPEMAGPGPMLPMAAPGNLRGKAREIGPGVYSLRYREFATPTGGSSQFAVYERGSRTGRLLTVATAAANQVAQAAADQGPGWSAGAYAGIGGGIMRENGGDIAPSFQFEGGLLLSDGEMLRLTLGLDTGFTKHDSSNGVGSATVIPVRFKTSLAIRLSMFRPYLALAVGMRVNRLSAPPGAPAAADVPGIRPSAAGSLGVGLHFSGFEGYLEGRFGKDQIGGDVNQATEGPALFLGARYFYGDG